MLLILLPILEKSLKESLQDSLNESLKELFKESLKESLKDPRCPQDVPKNDGESDIACINELNENSKSCMYNSTPSLKELLSEVIKFWSFKL